LRTQDFGGLKRQTAIGLFWSLGQAWGVRLITLLHYLVIARFLEPSDLGLVAFAITIVACLGSLADFGITTWIESSPPQGANTLDSAWWSTVIVAALMAGALVASAPALANWSEKPQLTPVLRALALTPIFSAASAIQCSLLKTHFMHRVIAIASLFACTIGSLTAIVCVVAGLSYWSLVAKVVLEAALVSAVLAWCSPWRPSWHFDRRAWIEAVRHSLPILGARVLEIANQRLDSLVIGSQLGTNALGFYATGQRLYQIAMEGLFSAVNQVSLPLFARFAAEPARAATVLLRLIACTSLLSFPIFALMATTAPDLITVFFGHKWQPAAPVLTVFCLGGVLSSVSYFNAPLLLASGHARLVFGLSLLNAILNTAGFLWAVRFGITAVASAFVIRGFLVYPINLILVRMVCGLSIRRYFQSLLPASMAGALASLAVWFWLDSNTTDLWAPSLRLFTGWALGIGVYLATIFLVFRAQAKTVLTEIEAMVRSTQGTSPSSDRAAPER
jgi:PST family polysaccharide transporter